MTRIKRKTRAAVTITIVVLSALVATALFIAPAPHRKPHLDAKANAGYVVRVITKDSCGICKANKKSLNELVTDLNKLSNVRVVEYKLKGDERLTGSLKEKVYDSSEVRMTPFVLLETNSGKVIFGKHVNDDKTITESLNMIKEVTGHGVS